MFRYVLTFEDPWQGQSRVLRVKLDHDDGPPLHLDGRHLLGLLSPRAPGEPLIVRHDLDPFVFTTEDEATARRNIEELRRELERASA